MNAIGTVASLKSLFGGSSSSGQTGKLGNFMSEIRSAGVARTNLFDVEITAPRILAGNNIASKLSLYAEGAVMPGRTISTVDVTRYGYGPHEKVPYSMQFNDVTLTMIGDGKGEVYRFFYNWMQGIVKGDYDLNTNRIDKNGKMAYEVEFKDQYACRISIKQYNEQGNMVIENVLLDAFPISVPDVSLNWSDSSMMSFSVTFAYFQNFLAQAAPTPNGADGVQGLSTLQKIVKVGSAIQVIQGLKGTRGVQGTLAAASSIKNLF